jgi:hypothetical protein
MNVMKLVQEMRGMAEINDWSPAVRGPAALPLNLRPPTRRTPLLRRKIRIRISMEETPDIPSPVAIKHLPPTTT